MDFKTFHESIIDSINNCSSNCELAALSLLIVGTKIPDNHDNIILAFKNKMEALGRKTDFGVEEIVLAQKNKIKK